MFRKFSYGLEKSAAVPPRDTALLGGIYQIILMRWKTAGWILVIAFMACLTSLYTEETKFRLSIPDATDFYKFYLSGQRFHKDETMYWRMPAREVPSDPCFPGGNGSSGRTNPLPPPGCLHPNLNPPFFNAISLPLMKLDYSVAWWSWSIGSTVCGLLSVFFMVSVFAARNGNILFLTATSACALFAYYPTFANFQYGQLTMFLLLPLTLGWLAMRNGRDAAAGSWLGLAASIKPFLGLFLILFILSKNKRASVGFVLVIFLTSLFGLWVAGFNSYKDYLVVGRDVTWFSASWNASFFGFFSRIFGGSENEPWLKVPALARMLSVFFSIAALLLVHSIIKKFEKQSRLAYADVFFALAVPAILLVSPLGWIYYFPLLCLTVPVMWRMNKILPNGRSCILMLGIGAALTLIPRDLLSSSSMNSAYVWFWEAAGFHYALLVVFATTAYSAHALGQMSSMGIEK